MINKNTSETTEKKYRAYDNGKRNVEYWGSADRIDTSGHEDAKERLVRLYRSDDFMQKLFDEPFTARKDIEEAQLERIRELVTDAWNIPLYHDKYAAAGFDLPMLQNLDWDTYNRLPVVTKDELIDAFPHSCINLRYKDQIDTAADTLFRTRTSGTSGRVLRILVDPKAVVTDTLQGLRQYWLQSQRSYTKGDLHAFVYSLPSWMTDLNKDYPQFFIDTLLPPEAMAEILNNEQPEILSLNASNLAPIIPLLTRKTIQNLKLVCLHSEMSSKDERQALSKQLDGTPVLDEYSSEEAARIALEMPCGHYHVCEDNVRLDVIDPETGAFAEDGATGHVVITNLLNEAMPFIKYMQGNDLITSSKQSKCPDSITWRQIERVEGRANDAFVRPDGQKVLPGTLLDLTYQWMIEVGGLDNIESFVRGFSFVQEAPNLIRLTVANPDFSDAAYREPAEKILKKLVRDVMGDEVEVKMDVVDKLSEYEGKRRPIRSNL